MRMISGLAAAAVATMLTLTAAGAADDGRDRVHADSFGNLVIYSHAGYKRIIVGMGEVAQAYQLTGSYYEPEIAVREAPREARRCWRPPYVWHGRSHMYGLDRGEVPQAPMVCR
ncbi:MAG: hypothetical protein M9895_18370 [Aquamicrobium sp.]|uniref:hypothetical protein n=1 Tax=Aquamicrobium sp. TaxID=1872579 RepID=UPI00349EFCCF|nr:hypothetical protein [Aquamicrobium sp.]MCO5155337.1 hypothetical protein [Aquamicrobium sp.]